MSNSDTVNLEREIQFLRRKVMKLEKSLQNAEKMQDRSSKLFQKLNTELEFQRSALQNTKEKVEERTAELQESQSKFSSMVSNVPGVIYRCLLDDAWSMMFISDEIQNLSGYPASDFLNNSKRTFADIIHLDDIKRTSEYINETLKKGETFRVDYRIITSEGEIKWVRGQGQAVRVKSSEIEYLDGVIFDITEQKLAEIEIANAEEKVRLILESAGEGILGVDLQGNTTFINSSATRMLGYNQDEIIGKGIHDLIHSKLHDGSNYPVEDCPMYKTYTNGVTNHVATEVLWRKDGSSFPVDYTSKPIVKDGNCLGAVITFSDITERKEVEGELLLSRYALDNAGDSILWIDVNNGKFKYVNEKSWTTLGYTQEELLKLCVYDIDPNFNKESWKQFSGKIIKEGIVNFESVNIRKSGELFPIEITASYIKFGEVEHIIAFTRDISERKKKEVEFQRINMLSDNALELTMSGFWDIDFTKDNLYHQSDRATAIFGMIPSENKIYKISDWFDAVVAGDPDIAKDVDDKFNGAIVGKYPTYDAIFPFKRPVDGEIVWIHALGIMERDEKGKALYMHGVTQDITDIKEAEIELEVAKAQAESATQAKSSFLATMSHEIRTPMNAIIGLSQLAMSTELNMKQYDYVKKINSSGYALLGIINDILDFSKIEAGKLTFEKVDFDLEQVFQEHADVVTYKAHEKNLEFVLGIDKEVPLSLIGDPLRLRQVLVNFVNNAIKFTSKGEITVKASLEDENEDNVKLQFSVKDSGIGIKQKKMESLFESFTQADDSTTRKYGGSGLGLAISKGIVEGLGGRIWAESSVGKGSTFYFEMIFGKQKKQKKQELKPIPDLRGLKVLLCDDNTTACEVLKATLEDLTFNVTVVSSGKDAIAEIRENQNNPYDLLLLDWKMPEMDGVETIKKIETDFGKSKIPAIIMVTAYSREDIYQEINELGVSGLLIKPISYSSLLDSVMDAFGKNVNGRQYNRKDIFKKSDLLSGIKGASLLLVEDNTINQQVAKELLEAAGCNVTIAENGQVAVNMLKDHPEKFQLVFMDIQMPIMDGFTATKHIRQKLNLKKIPIIAMTADAIAGVKENCLNVGMNEFITKPIDTDKLLDTLLKFIKPGTFKIVEVLKSETKPVLLNIPDFEYINKKEGLIRVNNNDGLYAELLGKFYDTYCTFDGDVKELMKKDASELKRYIHTLKGTAGNIGATKLHTATVVLESQLSSNKLTEFIENYRLPLFAVLKELEIIPEIIKQVQKPLKPVSDKPLKDYRDIQEQLSSLKILLEANDLDASDMVDQLLEENLKDEVSTKLITIKEVLGDFDFEKAINIYNIAFKPC